MSTRGGVWKSRVHRSQDGVLLIQYGRCSVLPRAQRCFGFARLSSEFTIFAQILLAKHPNLKSRVLRVRNFQSTDLRLRRVYRYSACYLFQESWAGRAGPDVTGPMSTVADSPLALALFSPRRELLSFLRIPLGEMKWAYQEACFLLPSTNSHVRPVRQLSWKALALTPADLSPLLGPTCWKQRNNS